MCVWEGEIGRERWFWIKDQSRSSSQSLAGVFVSGGYLNSRKKQHSCPWSFTPWIDNWNVALTLTSPRWKIAVREPVWHPFLLKWHDVGIRVKDSRHLPLAEKPLPGKRASHIVIFLTFPLVSLFKFCAKWVFYTPLISLQLSVYTVDSCVSDFENVGPWTATHIQGMSHDYVERTWGQSGWSSLPSESSSPFGCHGNGKTPIKPCGPTVTLGDVGWHMGSS